MGLYKMVKPSVSPDAHLIGDLGGEAGIYFQTKISPAEIGRRLLALGEKAGTQIGLYRAGITYPSLSSMPSTVEAARDQIEATILKSRDAAALTALSDIFQIEISDLADLWQRLRKVEPKAAHCLMEGRLHSALAALPAYRWGEIAKKLDVAAPDIRILLAQFILVWVANDLQIAAEATQVKIYTPTGIPAIDGTDPTIAPMIDGVSKRLLDEIQLFDRASDLLDQLEPGQLASDKQTIRFRNRGLDEQAEDFLEQWKSESRKDGLSGADLEQAIFTKLARGRRMVWRISKVVKKARSKRPGSKTVTIHHGEWLYSLQTPNPLERLYLACHHAATWLEPHVSPKRSGAPRLWAENLVDLLCGATGSDSCPATALDHPPEAGVGLASETARTLFYIMRNTVVEDPTHLPKPLGHILDRATGKTVLVRSNHEVRRRNGTKIPFSDIWGAFTAPGSKYDYGQTDVIDTLKAVMADTHYNKVFLDAKQVARGTILQRLS